MLWANWGRVTILRMLMMMMADCEGARAAVSWANTNQIHTAQRNERGRYHFQLWGRHKRTVVMRSLDSLRRPICGRIYGKLWPASRNFIRTSTSFVSIRLLVWIAEADFTTRNCWSEMKNKIIHGLDWRKLLGLYYSGEEDITVKWCPVYYSVAEG